MLALLELDLGCSANLDDRNAAGQLGQPLLQLLTVIVAVRLLDLGTDLVHATLNLLRVTCTFNDRGLIFGDDNLACATQQVERGAIKLEANFFRDNLRAGQDRDVLQHRLATVTKAWGLDRNRTEGATDLVDYQCRKGFAFNIFGEDDQRLAALHDLLEDWQDVLDGRDLGVRDEDVGILKLGLHALWVGDEVRRDVTLVEAHTLGEL